MMKTITSLSNPLIKSYYKLREKKNRDIDKLFLVEGYHLVSEAKKSNLLETVLITNEVDYIDGVTNILVSREIIEKLSFVKSPQMIIGVCNYFQEYDLTDTKYIILDNVQDPGNIGTLVRSALGFGINSIIFSEKSVDIYNDKFLRSTQGAIFNVKIFKGNIKNYINILKQKGIKIIGTSLNNSYDLKSLQIQDNYAIILGNEANGVSKEILDITDINVKINISKKLESLNVAVAGSIIMYYLSDIV